MLKREDGRNMGRNYLDGKIRPPVGLSHVVRARHRPVSVARSILALVQVWGLPYRFSRLRRQTFYRYISYIYPITLRISGRARWAFLGFSIRCHAPHPPPHQSTARPSSAPHRTSAREVLNHLQ